MNKAHKKDTAQAKLRFAILAADTVLLTIHSGALYVRLIPVHRPPHFKDKQGLPGGLLMPSETAEMAAERLIQDKARISLRHVYMEQLYTFSRINRDPRGRVVAVAYLALVPWEMLSTEEQANTKESWWMPVKEAGKLAYDHNEILEMATERLKARIGYTTVISKLFPKEFTLTDLEEAYAVILGKKVDHRNFRKKIAKLKLLTPLKRKRHGEKWRPAALYRFRTDNIVNIEIL